MGVSLFRHMCKTCALNSTASPALGVALIGPVDGAPTTFSAFLDCQGSAFDQRVVVTATQANPGTAVIDGIPVGVRCTFTEVDIPGQWSLGGVASPDVTIDGPDPVQVDAVNSRRTGDVTVVKRLAGSPAYPNQAFAYRRSYGLQFHLEVSPELAEEWGSVPAYAQSLESTLGPGALDRLLAGVEEHADVTLPLARRLFGSWLEHVARLPATAQA